MIVGIILYGRLGYKAKFKEYHAGLWQVPVIHASVILHPGTVMEYWTRQQC